MAIQSADMAPHMKTLYGLLTNTDLKGLLKHYLACNEKENLSQIAFLFQQGQIKSTNFDFYQQLATKFIESKGLPVALIRQIKNNDILSFFTPALQLKANFNKVNDQQRNVLHYLMLGDNSLMLGEENSLSEEKSPAPPFNYLRSLMLFESNELIHFALCQRDAQNFTPVETYLHANQNLDDLPNHELSALLALIEIESKKQEVVANNYLPIIQSVRKLCLFQNQNQNQNQSKEQNQKQIISQKLQRLLLIAAYYAKPIKQVVTDINL